MQELLEQVREWLAQGWQLMLAELASPDFYAQLAIALGAVIVAALLAAFLGRRMQLLQAAPADGPLLQMRNAIFRARTLIFPVVAVLLLGVAAQAAGSLVGTSWLVRSAQGLAAIVLLVILVSRLVENRTAKSLLVWVGLPIAALHVAGWLDDITRYLDAVRLEIGNFQPSLLAVLRTAIFGALLFWLGALSNAAGKNVIRTRETWNASTRELAAKLFEIVLFFVIFLLLLQIMGINLTALAVFGGALGIGLGFGLQQIASNFISGIIILLDRSISPGDYVELEDGRSGWLRELNMRYGILETYDGKDIMVPNEKFITSSYTNWTHKDKRQRYSLHFQVAYATDLDKLFELVREICRNHPKVISDPDLPIEFQPDAEIEAFGESGIDILVEFWMNGIDDGENRVRADLMHSIWRMIQEQGMQIPFPQHEIRILGGSINLDGARSRP